MMLSESNNKMILSGLTANDYIHPDELKMLHDSKNMNLCNEGLDILEAFSVSMVRKILLGKYVKISESNSRFFNIIKDCCRILDYHKIPELFVCHDYDNLVLPAGTDSIHILVSDCVLEEADDNMLYFMFGNAIGMYKGGHTRLNTVCSVMSGNPVSKPFSLALQKYLRAADLSSDRAGLLACQDFKAAAKCIFRNMGMPVSELRSMDENSLLALSKSYIKDTDNALSQNNTIVMQWKRIARSSSLDNKRLEELYNWYTSGSYHQLISRWR